MTAPPAPGISSTLALPVEGTVDVWCLRLDRGDPEPAGALLTADERARAGRYRFARDRDRWVRGRAGLRSVLSAYVGRPPDALRFAYGPQGKPALALPADAGLSFNLAHADGLGVVAIQRGGDIGVDVERLREIPDVRSVVRHCFAPVEQDAVLASPNGMVGRFYACWTRKEAIIKATGVGLTFGLDQFAVSVPPNDPPRLMWMADQPDPPDRWSLHAFVPARGFAGAVASLTPVRAVRTRWWP